MDPLDNFLTQARQEAPPLTATMALERRVMSALAREPQRRARQRWLLATAGVAVTALLTLFVWREPPARPAPDFSESTVIVGDLTCIWLEPVATAPEARP